MKDDGIIVVEVPNENWVKYPKTKCNSPPHVGFFSLNALRCLFKNFHIKVAGTYRGSLISGSIPYKCFLSFYNRIIFKLWRMNIIRIPYAFNGTCLLLVAQKKKKKVK